MAAWRASHVRHWSKDNGERRERLKALEEENAKLKQLYADTMLDNPALKDLLGRKW